MGKPKTVEAYHDGDQQLLSDLVTQDDLIQHFLVVHAVELHPARVPLGDGVLHVVENRPGSTHAPVGYGHDNGKSCPRRPMQLLMHVGQAVGRCGGEDSRPDERSRDAHTERRVLAFDPHEFRLELLPLDVFGKDFGDFGLGGDRISSDHLDPANFGCQGCCLVSRQNESLFHSLDILSNPRGQGATTIDDITQAAGITRGALYWHFSGKSDLLGAVVKRLKKDFLDRFIKETMAAGSHPMDRLWWTFKFNARFAVEHMDIVHCLRNLSLELSPAEDENVKAFFTILSKQRDFILNIIRDAQAKGDIRSDLKAEMLAALILATHDGILLQATAFKRILNGRELVWAFRQVMLAGMAADAKILHLGKSAGSREDTKAK